jgi:hypothetical protein
VLISSKLTAEAVLDAAGRTLSERPCRAAMAREEIRVGVSFAQLGCELWGKVIRLEDELEQARRRNAALERKLAFIADFTASHSPRDEAAALLREFPNAFDE